MSSFVLSKRNSETETEDDDSGIATDISESLAEDDLTFDVSYDDLLIELNESGISSDILSNQSLELCDEDTDTSVPLISEVSPHILPPKPKLPDIPMTNDKKDNGKVISFTKEEARQWRRKRILNSQSIVKNNISHKRPENLKPLLPLPGKLKPLTSKDNLITKHEKSSIRDPLELGEKIKHTRGLQPMKLRALPQSFWVEPKSVHTSSLARNNYAVLPPLFCHEGNTSSEEVMNVRPVTPPDERSRSPRLSPTHKKKLNNTSQADTTLLFSLFDHLENKVDERLIVRRGRPKKSYVERIPPPPKRKQGEDPCILDDLANKLFPELSLNNKNGKEKTASFAIVRIGKGERTIEFPAIQAAQNYPAILNELVTHM